MSDQELYNEHAIKTTIDEIVEEKLEDEEVVELTVTEVAEDKTEEAVVAEPIVEENIIVESAKPEETYALAPVENNAIGSSKVAKPSNKLKDKTKKIVPDEKVAVFSTSNVTWSGVGKVYRGINIVTAEAADKWLERSHIRIATPEEVAKEYGL